MKLTYWHADVTEGSKLIIYVQPRLRYFPSSSFCIN
jgi:hypothetical protein